ncbi:MAG: LacI family DNA-binding transcriptional regulator [bacterium]
MSPTIYDIAKKAKVGIGTVSRVLNNHPSVSAKTRKRVLKISERLNYNPHPYARGLARRKTGAVLAIIPYFTTFFFIEILQAVQSVLSEQDCTLILQGVNHPDQVEIAWRHHSIQKAVDGVLFFSMNVPNEFQIDHSTSRSPIILVDAQHKDFDSYSVRNQSGAFKATTYLLDLGFRKIGMLNANLNSRPAKERFHGYTQALTERGIPLRSQYHKHDTSTILDGFTRESGFRLMQEFISMEKEMPEAFFIASDIQAIGALNALREKGIHCPEDVAIIGFDDIDLAEYVQLTTMHQPMSEIGMMAAKRLLERMSNPSLPIIHETFEPELVIRTTTRLQEHTVVHL